MRIERYAIMNIMELRQKEKNHVFIEFSLYSARNALNVRG